MVGVSVFSFRVLNLNAIIRSFFYLSFLGMRNIFFKKRGSTFNRVHHTIKLIHHNNKLISKQSMT
jgi:hypothetical protein